MLSPRTVDMNGYVDDCSCQCQAHFTVKDGLLHVHGRPIFEGLAIHGSLELSGNVDLRRLPDRLAVTGSIYLSDCPNLKIMPSQLYVGESIHMDGIQVRNLPSIFEAGRQIVMNDCPNVLEIPAGVKTSCLYAAGCTKLRGIAPGLTFHVLDLSRTSIEELPADLEIKNELKLRNCAQVRVISEGVIVENVIDVRGCDSLFTLPHSVQPRTVITDGMMIVHDWAVVPIMTGEEAGMCLGRKALEAFPHRHFKNLARMQDPVVSGDLSEKSYRQQLAVGLLRTERIPQEETLLRVIRQRSIQDTLLLEGPAEPKRVK